MNAAQLSSQANTNGRAKVSENMSASAVEDVHVVVVLYYPAYSGMVARVLKELGRHQKLASVQVVINNPALEEKAIAAELTSVADKVHVLRHDNVGLEFGAYQRGLDALGRAAEGPFSCIFVNDTVGTHQPVNGYFLRNFVQAFRATQGSNAVVGRIDTSPRRIDIAGRYGTRWARANLFTLDYAALTGAHHTLYVPELNRYLVDTPEEQDFFAPDIPESLRLAIYNDLFEGGWDRSAPLTKENYLRMAGKGRSIIQELYLGMRLDGANTAFVNPVDLTKMEKLALKTVNTSWR